LTDAARRAGVPLVGRATVAAALGSTLFLQGCIDMLGLACTDELRSSIVIEVRDAGTGAPAALGATGLTVHEDGQDTELAAFDSLYLSGNWNRELPGDHSVRVRRPGFVTQVFPRVEVDDDACHVETLLMRVDLEADAGAVRQDPVFFSQGPQVSNSNASAGILIYGDTLEIGGFVPTHCRTLRPVAFRAGMEVHVQIESSDTPTDPCERLRQFKVRYLLPPGRTSLLVTNGSGFPVTLFAGDVRPVS
jgi:hypothetical protein